MTTPRELRAQRKGNPVYAGYSRCKSKSELEAYRLECDRPNNEAATSHPEEIAVTEAREAWEACETLRDRQTESTASISSPPPLLSWGTVAELLGLAVGWLLLFLLDLPLHCRQLWRWGMQVLTICENLTADLRLQWRYLQPVPLWE